MCRSAGAQASEEREECLGSDVPYVLIGLLACCSIDGSLEHVQYLTTSQILEFHHMYLAYLVTGFLIYFRFLSDLVGATGHVLDVGTIA